jgi:hypothetical protein
VVKIKEGGSVNFIISGLHLPAIYEDTQPELIDRNTLILTHPSTGVAIPAGGVINDVNNRVYRGLDPQFLIPSTNPQQVPRERDRVEVVQFTKPGTYLVICALRNHFFNPTSQVILHLRHQSVQGRAKQSPALLIFDTASPRSRSSLSPLRSCRR